MKISPMFHVGDRVWADGTGDNDWEPGTIAEVGGTKKARIYDVKFDSEPEELYEVEAEFVKPISSVTINRDNITTIHHSLEADLKKLMAQYGLVLNNSIRIKYGSDHIRFTVDAQGISDAASSEDTERSLFVKNCLVLYSTTGVKAEHYGAEFVNRGKKYRIHALYPNRPKFCIGCTEIATGKEILFPHGVLGLIKS